MKLTADQERDILAEYTGKLSAIANKFCRGKSTSAEDCLQELYIVFLKHIRQAETAEEIACLPMMDFKHAMCKQVLNNLPVSVPMRTTEFKRIMETIQTAGDFEEITGDQIILAGTDAGYAEADERISFDTMWRELSAGDRETVTAMIETGSVTETARALGVNKSTVSRNLKRIRKTYLAE